jgi:hypothetical protein
MIRFPSLDTRTLRAVSPVFALALLACEGSTAAEGGGGANPPADAGAGGVAVTGGSGGGGVGGAGAGGAPVGVPTWSADIAAIVGARCTQCHTAGAAAPFALDTYAGASAMAGAMADAVGAGRMPPWMADPACRHYDAERVMPETERATLVAWANNGAPAGDATVVAVDPRTSADPGPPGIETRAGEAYSPDPARPDDYRCFPLDARFDAETYVTMTDVAPDVIPIVHHVLVYVVPAERIADLEAMDAEEAGPGYTCYGGTNLGTVGPMAAWVPGFQRQALPEGVATVIPAGSRLVMQVHYNTLGAPPAPDRTEVHLWTRATPPASALRSRPLAHLGLEIAAGDANSVQTLEFNHNGRAPWTIVGVSPHMHMLGETIRVDARPDTPEAACLVDIPRWDFNWQQNYRFLPGEEVVMQPGEKLRLTCTYDNSPDNQPVFNGERLMPRDVTWGEGTTDEMCLAFINLVEPFTPNEGTCAALPACRDTCEVPGSFDCYLNCAQEDQPCATCLIQSIVGVGGCGRTACGAQLLAAGDCLRGCIPQAITEGTPVTACLEATCPAESAALSACMDPALDAGSCDADLAECDVTR